MESFVAIGRIHIPVYALLAAAGLMLAMAVGLRTAVLARIDRDAFWDLGLVTVASALVLSRLVLVLEDFNTFRQFPVAVLELPALSAAGVLLTLVVAGWYVWRRRLPVLGVCDAGAPCAALLWAFLGLASFAAGTREGMPTTMPWAVGSSFGRVHPVELYLAASWFVAFGLLFAILRISTRRGETAFTGLILGGLVFALTDFFKLPSQLYGHQALDGIEWRGLEMIVLGGLLLAWREAVPDRRRERLADTGRVAGDAI